MQNILHGFLSELTDLFGFKLVPKSILDWSDIFFYQFPRIQNVAAGAAAAPVTVQIQHDSDFEWLCGSFHFDLAQAAFQWNTTPIPNMSLNIIETGSGKQLMNANVPVGALFGAPGREPIALPQPKIFTRDSVVSITATNFDAAVATGDLWLTMIGRKLYQAPQATGG